MEFAADIASMGLVGAMDGFDFRAEVREIEDVDAIGVSAGGDSDDDVALFAGEGVMAEIAEDGAWRVEEAGGEQIAGAGITSRGDQAAENAVVGMGGVPSGNHDHAGAKSGQKCGVGRVEPAVVVEDHGVNGAEDLGEGCFQVVPGWRAVEGDADEVTAGVVIESSITDHYGRAVVVFTRLIFSRESLPIGGEDAARVVGDAGPDAAVDGDGADLELATVKGDDLVGAAGFEGSGSVAERVTVRPVVGEHGAGWGGGGIAAIKEFVDGEKFGDVGEAGEFVAGGGGGFGRVDG